MNIRRSLPLCLFAAAVAMLTACFLPHERSSRQSSSLVHYLYPRGMRVPDAPTIPTLTLPLRVGVAWVPDGAYSRGPSQISENQKLELLQRIVPYFKSYSFVRSIQIIPSTYLAPGGGFDNLDQVRAMYGLDIIALVSHDQVQFTSEGLLSFAYWTIVGAYVVQGERNETQTMLDTAVYDGASRKLLFRAPGLSRVKASSTIVNLSEQLRLDAQRGFEQAATNMVANLQTELAGFRKRVEESPDQFKVVRSPGYTGGGAMGWLELLLATMLGVVLLRRTSGARGATRPTLPQPPLD